MFKGSNQQPSGAMFGKKLSILALPGQLVCSVTTALVVPVELGSYQLFATNSINRL